MLTHGSCFKQTVRKLRDTLSAVRISRPTAAQSEKIAKIRSLHDYSEPRIEFRMVRQTGAGLSHRRGGRRLSLVPAFIWGMVARSPPHACLGVGFGAEAIKSVVASRWKQFGAPWRSCGLSVGETQGRYGNGRDPNFRGTDSARSRPILGMVPGVRHRFAGAWRRRRCAIGHSHSRLDVVFRLAIGDRVSIRNHSGRHGWALGGLLPPFNERNSLRGHGSVAGDETGDQRRSRDLRHGDILPDWRAV